MTEKGYFSCPVYEGTRAKALVEVSLVATPMALCGKCLAPIRIIDRVSAKRLNGGVSLRPLFRLNGQRKSVPVDDLIVVHEINEERMCEQRKEMVL